MIDVKIEMNELVIRLPIQNPPVLSDSGKTLVVASTRGNFRSTATIDSKPVTVGVNAYVSRN